MVAHDFPRFKAFPFARTLALFAGLGIFLVVSAAVCQRKEVLDVSRKEEGQGRDGIRGRIAVQALPRGIT